jgi:penicillin-binding protein 1C
MGFQSRYDEERPPYAQPTLPPTVPGVPQFGADQFGANRPRRTSRVNIACLGCALLMLTTVFSGVCGTTIIALVVWTRISEGLNARLEVAEAAVNGANTSTGNSATIAPGSFQTTTVYDRFGNELHELFSEGRRTKIPLAEISPFLIDATIAVEDKTFYDNQGFDLPGVLIATFGYLRGEDFGGASTITQQLVRNMAFDYDYRTERSPRRKIEEILMANVLTSQKSKDEILEMYLNLIYYGNLAYGIEAASQTYFGKSARDLNLAEAALLAGLPQEPARLDPFSQEPTIQNAVANRRDTVLRLMVETGKITAEEAEQAKRTPLILADPNVNLNYPHFTLYAEEELRGLLPALNLPSTYLFTGGLKVYTTLDPRFQNMAQETASNQIAQIREPNNANNAAVVILKNGTGEILAMLGSVDYNDEAIDGRVNMAIAPRQPGSSIKPLTYAAALERGHTAASVLWDVQMQIPDGSGSVYAPRNYDGAFHGPVRMRDALANSYNIPAVSMLRQVGVPELLAFAQRLGIQSLGDDASQYGLSLTLGGGAVSLLEMSQAYSVFANEGKLVRATSILCVVDYTGKVVYQYENGCEGKTGSVQESTIRATAGGLGVLDPRIAFVIRDILADNAARTPAMGARSDLFTEGILTSVKTGTTNEFRDNWTMGVSRNVTVGVWIGNSDNTPMRNTTGLTGAAPIWNQIFRGIYADAGMMETLKINGQLLSDELIPPPNTSRREICNLRTVSIGAVQCQPGRAEWFLDGAPLVPDGNGNLVPAPDTSQPPSTNGPMRVEIDTGVIQTIAQPLGAGLVMADAVSGLQVPVTHCLVPQEVRDQIPGAQTLVFIDAPKFPDEEIRARAFAQSAGLAILPSQVCNQEMLMAAAQPSGVTAFITSPQPGQGISGTVDVFGVASWLQGQAWYYKMEIRGAQFPEWTTFAGPNYTPVVNGKLGDFGAEGLAPGTYELRIVIVGNDGNYLTTSASTVVQR